MCIINLFICASCLCISYMHPSRASASLHHSVCKNWVSIMAIASCHIHHFIRMEKFHHCIALALQSYISRVHHSHGHRAYASRIIPSNLINSLSKNVLEQKLTLIYFLSRFTTRLRNCFFQDLDPLFSAKSCYMLVLEQSTGPFQPTLMVIVIPYIIHRLLLQKLKPWSFLVWEKKQLISSHSGKINLYHSYTIPCFWITSLLSIFS